MVTKNLSHYTLCTTDILYHNAKEYEINQGIVDYLKEEGLYLDLVVMTDLSHYDFDEADHIISQSINNEEEMIITNKYDYLNSKGKHIFPFNGTARVDLASVYRPKQPCIIINICNKEYMRDKEYIIIQKLNGFLNQIHCKFKAYYMDIEINGNENETELYEIGFNNMKKNINKFLDISWSW